MKKYKLIKCYPGSPALGYIFEEYNGYKGDYAKYPDYWEEIIEKDYEILSYYAKNISGKGDNHVDPMYIWKEMKVASGQWSRFCNNQFQTIPYSTSIINNHRGYGIHSVKRLSDGEIFTIGDSVIHKNEVYNKIGIIEKFIILSNGIWFKTNNYDVPMCYIQNKVKNRLFKTEDGIDIYENEVFYHVDPLWCICSGKTTNMFKKLIGYKEFSTREKAEEYVILNRPCLSIKDLISVEANVYSFNAKMCLRSLKELVKSKIKI